MSVAIAKAIGESYDAIRLLRLNGLMTAHEEKFAMRRLHAKAQLLGVGLYHTDVTGKPLQRQIRVSWMGRGGYHRSRTYPRWPGDKR